MTLCGLVCHKIPIFKIYMVEITSSTVGLKTMKHMLPWQPQAESRGIVGQCCREYLGRIRVQHFQRGRTTFWVFLLRWGIVLLTVVLIEIFEILMLQVQPPRRTLPTPADPGLERACSVFWGVLSVLPLEYTFACAVSAWHKEGAQQICVEWMTITPYPWWPAWKVTNFSFHTDSRQL